MSILILLCLVIFQHLARGHLIDAEVTERVECEGSVTIYQGSNESVITENADIKATLDLVKVEGCGCFTLHSRKGGNGRSFFLGRSGHYNSLEIGWSKVRSVRRASCDRARQ